jgi:rsbT co-antagonist protein RsbR
MDRIAREAQLLRGAPFAVVELDASLRLTAWNPAAARMFALRDEDVGAAVAERLAADDPAFWSDLAAADEPRVATMRAGDASQSIEWTAVRDEHGLACYASRPSGPDRGHDLGDRAAREQQLVLESAMLHAIVDNLDIIAWSMEEDGRCNYHRGKGLGALGMPQGAFVGQNIREMYRQLDPAPLDRVFAGQVEHVQTEVHGLHFENWMLPVRGASGRVELLVAISLNVDEQRRTELALREKLAEIEAQQRTIRELSTPIVEVWDRVLTLPILGIVDAARATEIMDDLLQAVTRSRARFAILDLTGVKEIDTATAGHLLGLVRAIRLLGAEGIVTGVHPNLAQTLVNLGVDLQGLVVRASLREALVHCIGELAPRG